MLDAIQARTVGGAQEGPAPPNASLAPPNKKTDMNKKWWFYFKV